MEMEILEDYHEVVDVLEKLMLFIFHGLNERYGKETELIRKVYVVEPFKLPEISNIPRIEFSQGVKMLREAGEALGDYDDLTTPQEKKLGQLVLEKVNSIQIQPIELSSSQATSIIPTSILSTSFPLLCVLSILCLPRRTRVTQTLMICLCVDKRFCLARNVFISTISSLKGYANKE
jgi:hypothetical protein